MSEIIKKKQARFQTLIGMHDILPEEQKYFQKIYQAAINIFGFYHFKKIDTPILEKTNLFIRSIGTGTDIIDKEIYHFQTKGGDEVALRPEFTASIVRAYIQHGMFNEPQPVKLFSMGPVFRHNKPQAGRYRQFHQINAEVLGSGDSIVDAQVIQSFYLLLKKVKIKSLIVEVNSIGDKKDREIYAKKLSIYFKQQQKQLCSDCQKRIKKNPLRIFDCKTEQCLSVRTEVPQIIDYISETAKEHFKQVLKLLDEIDLPYQLNPYLVRGLDYYNRTVFEIFERPTKTQESDQSKRNSLTGGGRYDYLVKDLGGNDVCACGGAMGVERVIELMKTLDSKGESVSIPSQLFLAHIGFLGKKNCFKLLQDFKKAKISIMSALEKPNLRKQLEYANKLGSQYILIIGEKEAIAKTVIVKHSKTRDQKVINQKEIVEYLKEILD